MSDIKDLLRVQGSNGNWNYDEYMHGMYNGMELIAATIENREPEFKKKPKRYLRPNLFEKFYLFLFPQKPVSEPQGKKLKYGLDD